MFFIIPLSHYLLQKGSLLYRMPVVKASWVNLTRVSTGEGSRVVLWQVQGSNLRRLSCPMCRTRTLGL